MNEIKFIKNPKTGRLIIDESGKIYGYIRVLEFENMSNQGACYLCECVCGKKFTIAVKYLKEGNNKSCGCKHLNKTYEKFNNPKDYLINFIYNDYKNIHKTKKIKFDLTIKNINSLIFQNCFYCDLNVSMVKYINRDFLRSIEHLIKKQDKNKNYEIKDEKLDLYINLINLNELYHFGLDKINPKKGYCLNNVVPCCYQCNKIKWDYSQDDFFKKCYLIKNNINNKNEFNNYDSKTQNWVVSNVLKYYKSRAKRKNINFLLSNKNILILIYQKCFYCNTEPNKLNSSTKASLIRNFKRIKSRHKNKHIFKNIINYYTNGIDRINSNNAYDIDNCVTCCKQCNIMKLNYTQEEFLEQINRIVKHHKLEEKYEHLTEDELYPKHHLKEKSIEDILREDLGLSGEEITSDLIDFLTNLESEIKSVNNNNNATQISKHEKRKASTKFPINVADIPTDLK